VVDENTSASQSSVWYSWPQLSLRPYTSAKEHCTSVKEPCIFTKEPCVSANAKIEREGEYEDMSSCEAFKQLRLRLCVYMHVYVKYVHECIFTWIYVCIQIHIFIWIYVCIYPSVLTVYGHVYVCIHAYIRLVHSYIHVFMTNSQTEEIGLKIITTAKISNKLSQESPYISNTFSWESPKFLMGFRVSKRSPCHSKECPGKLDNLEIQIFQVWSPPWVVTYVSTLVHAYIHIFINLYICPYTVPGQV